MILRHYTYRFGIPREDDTHCISVVRETADTLVVYGIPLDPAALNPVEGPSVYVYPEDSRPLGIRAITITEGDMFLMFPCGVECDAHVGQAVHYDTAI